MQRAFIYISSLFFILLFAIGGKPDYGLPQDKKIAMLRDLGDKYERDIRIKKLDSIYYKSIGIPNDSINRFFISKLGHIYGYCDDNEKYIKTSTMCYKMAKKAKDTFMMAASLNDIGLGYHLETKIDSAYYNYMKAGELYLKNGDYFNYAKILQQAGALECTGGLQYKAEKHMIKAIQIFDSLNRPRQVLDTYCLITVVLQRLKNYDAALNYHRKIDRLLKSSPNLVSDEAELKNMLAVNYANLGELYFVKIDYKKAIEYSVKGVDINIDDKYLRAMIRLGCADARIMFNAKAEKKQIDYDIKQAYRDLTEDKSPLLAIRYESVSGQNYLQNGDTIAAINYFKMAYNDARKIKSNDDLLILLPRLATIDRQNAKKYARRYFSLNDSITNIERSLSEKFSRIAYETETVQQQNKQLKHTTNYTLVLCVVLLLFAGVSYIIFRLRNNNKQLKFAKQQEEANEKIYTLLMQQETTTENARMQERNRLAMELHDGVMNRIFTTRFNLENLSTANEPEKQQVIQELYEAQNSVRQLSHRLKQSFLAGNNSFATALTNFVAIKQKTLALDFELYIDKFINWAVVAPETRVVIFSIIQDACATAKKQSGIKKCNIAIMAQGTAIKLRIWDDGKGFLPNNKKPKTGIRKLTERVTALGGTISLKSTLSNGTVLDVLLQAKE